MDWAETQEPRPRPDDRPCEASAHRIESFDRTAIWYDLYPGTGDSVVVILPGFWRTRRHTSIIELAAALTKSGHHVVAIDLRGHGDSGGRFGFNRHEYRDAEAVMGDVAERLGRVHFGLLGLSMGGAVAVTVAARSDFDVRCLVLVSPVADFQRIRPRLKITDLPKHLSMGQAVRWPRFEWRFLSSPKIVAEAEMEDVTRPTCLIHAVDDWLIDHTHSERLHACHGGECELHLLRLPCGYHADRVFSIAPGTVESIVIPFFSHHLGSGQPN